LVPFNIFCEYYDRGAPEVLSMHVLQLTDCAEFFECSCEMIVCFLRDQVTSVTVVLINVPH